MPIERMKRVEPAVPLSTACQPVGVRLVQVVSRLSCCLLLCWLGGAAHALPTGLRMSQLAHNSWKIQDGFFNGAPNAITQTTDGYLWIGSNGGLTRFDGVRFQAWDSPSVPAVPAVNIYALLGSRDGSLWIGTLRGLLRLKDGMQKAYLPGRINKILEDPAGVIWIVRSRTRPEDGGPLCKVSDAGVRCFGKNEGIDPPTAQDLALEPSGTLLIASGNGVISWQENGGRGTNLAPTLGKESRRSQVVQSDGDCAIVTFNQAGPGAGVQRLCDERWQPLAEGGIDGPSLVSAAILRSRDGTLWIGTAAHGIYRVQGSHVENYRSSDGLSNDGAGALYEDREGSLWVLTGQGMDRFRPLKVKTFSTTEGLRANYADAVLAGSGGKVWISNRGSLDLLENGNITSITPDMGLPGLRVTSLLEDHAGVLWVGIDKTLYVYDRGSFSEVSHPALAEIGQITCLVEDSQGDVWALTVSPAASLIRIHSREVVDRRLEAELPQSVTMIADPAGGILLGMVDGRVARYREGKVQGYLRPTGGGRVRNFVLSPDQTIWASTLAAVVGWKGSDFRKIDASNGLPCALVYSIVQARNGDMWVSQPCGLVRIPLAQVDRLWSTEGARIEPDVFDALDGAQPGRSDFSPNTSTAADGSLWFANEFVVQTIDLYHLEHNTSIPPVHVERVVADHKQYSLSEVLSLPAGTRDLEIDYTALSLMIPQKVRFRYRLEGWDKDWQDPGTRRQAFYTNLDPGHYSFRVKASNNDGVWNDRGASLDIAIQPAYYQTRWFIVSAIVAVVLCLYLSYRLRIRQIAWQIKSAMLERLSERERIARDLHDSFFQGIQGLLLRFNTATAQLNPDEPARAVLIDTLQQSDRVMLEGRELLLDLRTSATDIRELAVSLTQAGEELKNSYPADFLAVTLGAPRALHPVCAEELYRLGREALSNAFRHAKASRIELELHYDASTLTLRVRDDGQGIDDKILKAGVREGHWGLPGMRERAKKIGATVKLWSRQGRGTEIEVVVPSSIAYVDYRPGALRTATDALARKIGLRGDAKNG